MLYKQEDFEPLIDEPWDEARIRAAIRETVADTDAALRGPKLLWRADSWDRWRATSPLKDVYCGAAGVLWALADLRDRGHAETTLDLADLALHVLERQRVRPDLGGWTDLPQPSASSLLSGEAGIILVAFRLTRDPALADALYVRVRENVDNEADELMWGAPGTLVAARLMLDWTGDPRWRVAWDAGADAVLARRDRGGQWTQLLGTRRATSAPCTGSSEASRRSCRSSTQSVGRLSCAERTPSSNAPRSSRTASRLAARRARAFGKLTRRDPAAVVPRSARHPLRRSHVPRRGSRARGCGAHVASRCTSRREGSWNLHGTAGNGYALLQAFERTGDERWLERARRFAVHALTQVRRQRAARGRGRYSLFTGDPGVALYLASCLDARAALPVLDAD